MRGKENETIHTTPPAARVAIERVEPPTYYAVAVSTEKVLSAAGIIDGFVHRDEPDQTHRFDVLIREILADEAGYFGIGFCELPLVGLGANLARDTILVGEKLSFENHAVVRDAGGRLEIRRVQDILRPFGQPEVFLLQTSNPLRTSRAVGGDGEVDDAVLLHPCWFGPT